MSLSIRGGILPTTLLFWILAAGQTLAIGASPSYQPGMPDEVQSIVESGLSRDQYLAMADQWQQYAQQHPRSALAPIMVYQALYYGGEQDSEKLQNYIKKALALDPDCPEALVAAMSTVMRHSHPLGDLQECHQYGLKAVEAAPQWPQPHLLLFVLATRLNHPQEAEQHLKALLEKGYFTPALLDYGYNMLISADPGGIIFTNGDNDTFPCLALQAGRHIRTDVSVVNISLMTLPALASRYLTQPSGGFAGVMTPEELSEVEQTFANDRKSYGYKLGNALLGQLCRRSTAGRLDRPLYLAVTLFPDATSRCGSALSLEGLLERVMPGDPGGQQPVLNLTRTYDLFRKEYRLDSATDLNVQWQKIPAHLQLINNYTNILVRLGYDAATSGNNAAMEYGFNESLKIASFHHDQAMVQRILDYWPNSTSTWDHPCWVS